MAKRVKQVSPSQNGKSGAFLKSRIERVNAILGKLEGELEKAIKGVIAKGEQSSHELRKTFDEMLEWVKNGQLYAIANETKETLIGEIHKLKTETLAKVKEIESVASKDFFQEIRAKLSGWLERAQGSAIVGSVVESVKVRASRSKEQILEALNIPNQGQLHGVERRVDRLEKKVQTLLKKAA